MSRDSDMSTIDSEFMGYNIEDNPCLKENVTCTFTVINVGTLLKIVPL